jgi:pimeloyl-ACP methyl ester carboxylesterase
VRIRRSVQVLLSTLAIGGGLLAVSGWAGATATAKPKPELAPFGHSCTMQNGVRFCPTTTLAQRVPTFDGVPLDADVTLPSTGTGPFPTIVMMHGWGGSKTDFESSSPAGNGNDTFDYNNVYYAQHGFAVLNYSARGWGRSCGTAESREGTPGCEKGWVHLADQRYEARDTQYLLGLLADANVTKPGAIGVTGISYGGGQSIELAYLKNQIRLPNGKFSPWVSPKGKAMKIAAAYPRWPWSDLVDALTPNGRFLDTEIASAGQSREPLGVEIQSYDAGLFALGQTSGFIAPAGQDPEADLSKWFAVTNAGEPASKEDEEIANKIYTYHQGYGLSGTPAPLLIQNGWTDDLFPPEQALRVYNSVLALKGKVTLQFGDLGHSRGSNKENTDHAFQEQGASFFEAKLKQVGTAPASGSVTAYTQTCPQSAPGGGPFTASSWSALHPGTVTFGSPGAQTFTSAGGNPTIAAEFDPIGGTTDACKSVKAETETNTGNYTMVSSGFTMMGLPTVKATIKTLGPFGELVSRLWDVTPGGEQRLISRSVYRLLENQTGTITFQLHGNGYAFPAGDTVKLQLLGRDTPYYRASNGVFSIEATNVTASLPTP